MQTQKHLFQLPDDIHYLNGGYMSPLLKSSEAAGVEGIALKRNPYLIKHSDFFDATIAVKTNFSRIVNCTPAQVAVLPSASYGLKTAVSNIPINSGDHVLIVGREFPSGYYCTEEWCKANQKTLKIINAPDVAIGRGAKWNEELLTAINITTCAVVISSIHWTDGTCFDLEQIGKRCRETDTLFIVDGTQSVGAKPIDVVQCKIDALICSGYKWLLGPYAIAMGYFGEAFNQGIPIESSWMNRDNATDVAKLSQYSDGFMPDAARYNVGQSSNFILLPMLNAGMEQILQWGVEEVEKYSRTLTKPLITYLHENGFRVEEDTYRSAHLFGLLLPENTDRKKIMQELKDQKVIVSFRNEAIRISTHVYNTGEDVEALIGVLKCCEL